METTNVVVVGGANLDIGARSEHALQRGDSTPGTVCWSAGGVARNVAENLARLGHTTRLFSAVGDDLPGHSLLQATRQAGVDVSGCWIVPDATTASYVSVHDASGEEVVAVNDMGVLAHLTPERLQPLAGPLREASALVVDCNLSEAALGGLFAHLAHRAHGAHPGDVPVFVDAVSASKCPRILPWLARVHTLKLNRLEAQALVGVPLASRDSMEAAARWLHGRGVRRVVLSVGADGLLHSECTEGVVGGAWHCDLAGAAPDICLGWQAALPATVCNASGAGDALLAGLVHAHLRGEPLAVAARFASACAALTLTTPSTCHAGLSQACVEALLARHPPADAPQDPVQPAT